MKCLGYAYAKKIIYLKLKFIQASPYPIKQPIRINDLGFYLKKPADGETRETSKGLKHSE